LDNFELFLEEGKITTHAERCGAFLSRLDGQTKQTLSNYDRHVKTNYNTLKDAFIKMFKSGALDIDQYKKMIGTIPQEIKKLEGKLNKDLTVGDEEEI
jgi:hypothetical protein